MSQVIRIASRSSPLALAQIEEIVSALKAKGRDFAFSIQKIDTTGDRDKQTPLTQTPDNFFTDAIDRALLEGQADIAIHSAKDLPKHLAQGLNIFALTKGQDDRDAWVGRLAWKDLPSGAKIGTSSVLRQQQILQLRPDVNIVNIRGTIQERLQLIKDGKIDGAVMALCALQRLNLESEVKDIFPWEGTPLQGQLAMIGRTADRPLADFLSVLDARRQYGKVMLVGAGPGDPDLITLKGIKALQTADCIFYDYLVDDSLLKYAPQAEHIYAGKRKGAHSLSQQDLSRMLKEKALQGKNVVRLKGGDPLIFGRGADEIQYLRAYHIDVEVIPGITSATGIASTLGIPLTARGVASSVAFVSGHEEDEDRADPKPIPIPQADTLVFFMGLTKLPMIVESLQKAGKPADWPMMIIANGTKPQEQIVQATLGTIESQVKTHALKPPALIIAGKTLTFYQAHRQKIYLHCGTHPDLYQRMGKILHWPMIEIKPVSMNATQQQDLLNAFKAADIIVLTSWYATAYLIESLKSIDANLRLADKSFVVIGPRSAKPLQAQGVKPAIISIEETAEGLFKIMDRSLNLKGKKILLPRSSLPNPYLKEALVQKGAIVTEITIYENIKPPKRPLPEAAIAGIIFTSPSTVRNFLTDYATIPDSWTIMAKGPVTLKTLKDAGYTHVASLS